MHERPTVCRHHPRAPTSKDSFPPTKGSDNGFFENKLSFIFCKRKPFGRQGQVMSAGHSVTHSCRSRRTTPTLLASSQAAEADCIRCWCIASVKASKRRSCRQLRPRAPVPPRC
ncbi:unnamed protein product [Protopolystoma xenopodis]|uniref:Uncharacterized protein n=1 Tax=Protopolystoma xenopodis TaxID=117903 RepID=A0A448XK56_9PLAT|nr:unnamed protein product [Protopolystoma xenopodis]